MTEYDVVIAGFGPTGAVAANLLGQRGVRVLAVDPSPEIFQIPRAVHFDGETMRTFQRLGLAKDVLAVSGRGEGLTFLNAKGRTLLSSTIADFRVRHAWPSANFFNQPMLEAHLRRGAARFDAVEVRLGWGLESFTQDEEGVRVALRSTDGGESEEVRARYLLGCDGASSATRERAGIPLIDLDCDEPWLVVDWMLEEGTPFSKIAYQICDWHRPTTLVPCEGKHIRWEFMFRPGDEAEVLEREENVRAMMAPHLHLLSPDIRADDGVLVRSKVYTFHGLIAERWREGRVFILGDAAHQTPPFLGQGLCAGIRDAVNLCWKLEGVLAGRIDESVLDSYGSERAPHARAVVEQAIRIGGVIQATSRVRAFLRDCYFALARIVPALKRPFLWEPSWPLGPGLFDPEEPPSSESAHGNPIDQGVVETAAGESGRLDRFLGDDFALLCWNFDPAEVLPERTRKTLAELPARVVHVVSERSEGVGGDALLDSLGRIGEWFEQVGGGRAVLVRPDRQVFGVYGKRDGDLGADVAGGVARLAAKLGGSGDAR